MCKLQCWAVIRNLNMPMWAGFLELQQVKVQVLGQVLGLLDLMFQFFLELLLEPNWRFSLLFKLN